MDEPPHLVRADPDRLQQAVWNLLANAVKFTDAGRVTVSLSHTTTETLIVVDDTGIGIDPLFLPHIFEPFRQADASSTRNHAGLGLGLAIVREIAQAHGGRLEAFSDGPGRGSRFVFRMPTAQPVMLAAAQPPRSQPGGGDTQGRQRAGGGRRQRRARTRRARPCRTRRVRRDRARCGQSRWI